MYKFNKNSWTLFGRIENQLILNVDILPLTAPEVTSHDKTLYLIVGYLLRDQ